MAKAEAEKHQAKKANQLQNVFLNTEKQEEICEAQYKYKPNASKQRCKTSKRNIQNSNNNKNIAKVTAETKSKGNKKTAQTERQKEKQEANTKSICI